MHLAGEEVEVGAGGLLEEGGGGQHIVVVYLGWRVEVWREGWRGGPMEGWNDGRMEGWRMEGWGNRERAGGMEGWKKTLTKPSAPAFPLVVPRHMKAESILKRCVPGVGR